MKKILMSLMAASLVLPTATLASSIRPGSPGIPKARTRSPLCLDAEEKYTEKCDIVIDDTGVVGPVGTYNQCGSVD
jgi:hypothetical protein